MVTRGATNSSFKDCRASVEGMSRSPLLAAFAPIGSAFSVRVSQVVAMAAKTGGESRVKMSAKFDLQLLKEFECSFDKKCIQQIGFDLLADCIFDTEGFESSQLKIRMINEMNGTARFAVERHGNDEAM